ncbi:phosphatidylinositol 4-kinase gamma 2 [Euphorbia lathyris]|uniref:phosphatidylinositol 4-kinase gamma 2 n=1 Tax=Euphorbia lathyris TaxID=212925 RepID=UPI003313423B
MSAVKVAFSSIHRESPFFHSYCNNSSNQGPAIEDSSILIYLSVAGSLIPMRVLEMDSIASVKLRIQTCKGFVVKNQKLVFGGRELARNDTRVKDYGVTNGKVLHLVLKLSDLLLITVRTTSGREFVFHVDRFRNVGYLKKRIYKEGHGFVDVEEQEIFYNGKKLDDQKLIGDICGGHDASIHLLVQKSARVRATPFEKDLEISIFAAGSNERRESVVRGPAQSEDIQVLAGDDQPTQLQPVIVNPKVKLSPAILNMVQRTLDGLEGGKPPIRSSDGTGGTYLMRDPLGQEFVSVFKPIDEEPMAVHNPQGLPVSTNGEGLKKGTRVGGGAVREVAAYLLDHPTSGKRKGLTGEVMGFAGVPPTILVQCLNEAFNYPEGYEHTLKNAKVGSLQMFIKNDGSCDEMGPGSFPVGEVHKISVLDMRLANADRHGGNILLGKGDDGRTVLIPIDHGYCLPEKFEDCTFEWLYWPQAREPYSAEVIDYVNSLDAEQDIALLKHHGWDIPIESARTLRISTMLLKKGVKKGLTPFAIGSIMCRETLTKESIIEEIVNEAIDSLLPGMSEATFLETVSEIMDSRLDKLAK